MGDQRISELELKLQDVRTDTKLHIEQNQKQMEEWYKSNNEIIGRVQSEKVEKETKLEQAKKDLAVLKKELMEKQQTINELTRFRSMVVSQCCSASIVLHGRTLSPEQQTDEQLELVLNKSAKSLEWIATFMN